MNAEFFVLAFAAALLDMCTLRNHHAEEGLAKKTVSAGHGARRGNVPHDTNRHRCHGLANHLSHQPDRGGTRPECV